MGSRSRSEMYRVTRPAPGPPPVEMMRKTTLIELSFLLWSRVLFDHPQHGKLRIGWRAGDRCGFFKIKWWAFPLFSVVRRQDKKVSVGLFRVRANGNHPQRATCRTNKGVKVVVVLQDDRASAGSVRGRAGVFPNGGFDFVKAGRKCSLDLLILPQALNYF